MKKITIHKKSGSKVVTYDDCENTVDEMTEMLTEMYKLANIATLKTTSGNIVVRPSEIEGIYVEEVENVPSDFVMDTSDQVEENACQVEKVEEDIITDMD